MNDELFIIAGVALLILACILVLPLVALFRTAKIKRLERRIEGMEAALLRVMRLQEQAAGGTVPAAAAPSEDPVPAAPAEPERSAAVGSPEALADTPVKAVPPSRPAWQTETLDRPASQGRKLEEVIGERWLGWVGVAVILFSAAFALKYAFENRWIGELGRVMIGVLAGLGFVWLGRKQHRAGWKYLAHALTAGGATLLYLATYASYGFYDLIAPTAAFVFLVVIVIETHLLALVYRAPGIALWGQIGGFLTPILLSTGRDRYSVLFPYIALLDAGIVAVCLLRGWRWVSSVSFVLTHMMFWGWYDANYHPEKLWPAVALQAVVFVLFALADFEPVRRGRALGAENWIRLFVNPFIFFASCYALLEPEHPAWMGVFALLMALAYAWGGRTMLGWARAAADSATSAATSAAAPTGVLAAVGVSLAFVTLAIPIQLEANWITLAWGVQAVVLVWLSLRLRSERLRWASLLVFVLAVGKALSWDFAWHAQLLYTPIWNSDFLTAVGLAALLALAGWLLRDGNRKFALGYGFAAVLLTWLTLTFETYRYTEVLIAGLAPGDYEGRRSLEWAGNMGVSVLWSCYAAALVGAGLRWGSALLRWAGLALFGLTVAKAFLIDIAVLEGFYRVIGLFALGLLLIGAAWGYQKIARKDAVRDAGKDGTGEAP